MSPCIACRWTLLCSLATHRTPPLFQPPLPIHVHHASHSDASAATQTTIIAHLRRVSHPLSRWLQPPPSVPNRTPRRRHTTIHSRQSPTTRHYYHALLSLPRRPFPSPQTATTPQPISTMASSATGLGSMPTPRSNSLMAVDGAYFGA